MLFIGIENQEKQGKAVPEIEAEVDYEGKLISSLNDLQEERKKNKILTREVTQLKQIIEGLREVKQALLHLRKQVREAKETTESLISQLQEKDIIIRRLEAEIEAVREKGEHRSS